MKELLTRGVEKIIDARHLKNLLSRHKPLRIKHGIDPTGPRLHIGRAVTLLKLRDFQQLGHRIVLIIGDFTARIGDASDKQSMRNFLSQKEIEANMKDYKKQIGKILDLSKTEIRYNSEWLDTLKPHEFIDLATHFSAQQMIQRRNFKERWESGKSIGVHELFYPLLQGFDSVAVKADVEIGGSDQLFNLTAGREIQKIYGQEPQDIITMRMLLGLDGRKMSTTWDNCIYIDDSPQEQFGKIMSIRDDLILDYLELTTDTPRDIIQSLRGKLMNKTINPRDAKIFLGKRLVARHYGEKEAVLAAQEFKNVFSDGLLPQKIPVIKLVKNRMPFVELLIAAKITKSKSAAKRLIEQNGVAINGKPENNWRFVVEIKKNTVLKIGKKRFIKLI